MARDSAAHGRRRGTGRRVTAVVVAAAVVAGGVYGATALTAHGRAQRPKAAGAPSAQTTRVDRTDLANSQTLPGTLGFGRATTVKGAGKGSVTRLPAPGSTVDRGKPLYWVDDQPVMVFFGDTPVFRKLDKPGVTGRDVTVLAENLKALGYAIGTGAAGHEPAARFATGGAEPGTKLTAGLLAALKRWQRDTGQQQTGTLDVGQVAVLPGTVRVQEVTAQLGDPAAEELCTVTSGHKSVDVKADADSAGTIHEGGKVTITLPDSRRIPGEVASVGTTVEGGASVDGADGAAGPGTTPTLHVTVVPADSHDVNDLDAASVQVTFATETRRNVLVVPVGALLALSEGGYALQRPDGRLVAVKTGLFAKGLVEITGDVEEGDRVVTTS